jgi:hypothetical protein
LGAGGAAALSETQRMIYEKIIANAQAQFAAGMALAAGRGNIKALARSCPGIVSMATTARGSNPISGPRSASRNSSPTARG